MSRPPRLQTFNYRGCYRYFLTICTDQRHAHFRDRSIVDLVRDQIQFTAVEQSIANIAYCFMPDHLHMLVAGDAEPTDFKKFAMLMKQRSGWRFARQHGDRLWQAGYYDRVLRDDEHTKDVVRYIVENPVRAALAHSPHDYPFWGSDVYTRDQVLDFVQDACTWRT